MAQNVILQGCDLERPMTSVKFALHFILSLGVAQQPRPASLLLPALLVL